MGVITAKMVVKRQNMRHQASHDFWVQQNCSLARAPITHDTPLTTQDTQDSQFDDEDPQTVNSESRIVKALSTLSQKSATVAENGETTAKFGDCCIFLRQCGQALSLT